MASGSRRKFSPQFKAEAVQLVVQDDRPITQVAQELQINPGTLGNWVNKYRRDNVGQDEPLPASERVRLSELEVEVRRLRMENEFLKKVCHERWRRCCANDEGWPFGVALRGEASNHLMLRRLNAECGER